MDTAIRPSPPAPISTIQSCGEQGMSLRTALCSLEEVSGVLDQLKQGGVIGRVVAKI